MAGTVTVVTATGATVMQATAQGWIRGLCPCCGSDVVAVDGQHACLQCDFAIEVPDEVTVHPARLPDGRRYFKPWRRAYRAEGSATAPVRRARSATSPLLLAA
jgi:hypothetical protein